MNMKELMLHTLKGDIYTCGKDGMTKIGIKRFLENRYVNIDTDICEAEFNNILDEQYEKVKAWRLKNTKPNCTYN